MAFCPILKSYVEYLFESLVTCALFFGEASEFGAVFPGLPVSRLLLCINRTQLAQLPSFAFALGHTTVALSLRPHRRGRRHALEIVSARIACSAERGDRLSNDG